MTREDWIAQYLKMPGAYTDEAHGHLFILYNNQKGMPASLVIAPKGKKPYSHLYFKNTDQRNRWIQEQQILIERNLQNKSEWKDKKNQRLIEFKAQIQPGKIVYTSWGYSMTFVDFYRVLSVKGNSVQLIKLESVVSSGNAGYSGTVIPGLRTVGEPFIARFTSNGLKLNDDYAKLYDFKPKYFSRED
jgi:hypothetical protein